MREDIEQRAGSGRCSVTPASFGFTLLELLVVVAIIGILVGIMLPAIGGVKIKAQIKKAESGVKSLAVACRAYHTEYGYWPLARGDRGMDTPPEALLTSTNNEFMTRLTALAFHEENPRSINFIEWQAPLPGEPGMVDPFRSNQAYRVSIKVSDNSVTVWSFGPDGVNGGGDDISAKN